MVPGRIQDLPEAGDNPKGVGGGANLLFNQNYGKLHENEKNIGPRGGLGAKLYYVDPPQAVCRPQIRCLPLKFIRVFSSKQKQKLEPRVTN